MEGEKLAAEEAMKTGLYGAGCSASRLFGPPGALRMRVQGLGFWVLGLSLNPLLLRV